MKDAYYFPHDANARHDLKMLALKSVYGIEGYGRYWILVEMMREHADYRIEMNNTKYAYAMIAEELKCTEEETKKFIKDCIEEFHLFETDGQYLWSQSLNKRMEKLEEKRIKLSEAGKRGADKRWGGQCDPNGVDVAVEEVKEVKKRKEKEYAPTIKMLPEEYDDLCQRFGKRKIDTYVEKISDWQLSNGVRKKSMPATIKNWMRRDAGVESVKDLEIKIPDKCPKCGKALDNEIRNDASSCYRCGHVLKNKSPPQ